VHPDAHRQDAWCPPTGRPSGVRPEAPEGASWVRPNRFRHDLRAHRGAGAPTGWAPRSGGHAAPVRDDQDEQGNGGKPGPVRAHPRRAAAALGPQRLRQPRHHLHRQRRRCPPQRRRSPLRRGRRRARTGHPRLPPPPAASPAPSSRFRNAYDPLIGSYPSDRYPEIAQLAGSGELFAQLYVRGEGHCAFRDGRSRRRSRRFGGGDGLR
jgi:hypothetical protein